MQKSVFIFLWCIAFLIGYFIYFSPESVYQLELKKQLLSEINIKNQQLRLDIESYQNNELSTEKQNYFVNMGYFEKNQIIVDIKLPSLLPSSPTESTRIKFSPNLIVNQDSLSPILFFFFLSIFVIIFFIFYYQKKTQ